MGKKKNLSQAGVQSTLICEIQTYIWTKDQMPFVNVIF